MALSWYHLQHTLFVRKHCLATYLVPNEVSNVGANGSWGTFGTVSPPGWSILNALRVASKIGNEVKLSEAVERPFEFGVERVDGAI